LKEKQRAQPLPDGCALSGQPQSGAWGSAAKTDVKANAIPRGGFHLDSRRSTVLEPKGKAIVNVNKGEAFYGEVDILGKPYVTGYDR
jgi:hypothetical protein